MIAASNKGGAVMGKLMDEQMKNLKGVITDDIVKSPKKK